MFATARFRTCGVSVVLSTLAIATGLYLDILFGEPRKLHPLVGFGMLANKIERILNQPSCSPALSLLAGTLGCLLLIAPLPVLAFIFLPDAPVFNFIAVAVAVWFSVGLNSLAVHASAVGIAFTERALQGARIEVSKLVSRDCDAMNEQQIASATVESILENGSDAVIASLFWALVAGVPGVLAHRFINTLDAMWGYRNPRFQSFGFFAAKLDDLANWLPARLCALLYACCGKFRSALQCWHTQGASWESPNAGVVIAAGAGSLQVKLGGAAFYAGEHIDKPSLGTGRTPALSDIPKSITLLHKAVLGCIALFLLLEIALR